MSEIQGSLEALQSELAQLRDQYATLEYEHKLLKLQSTKLEDQLRQFNALLQNSTDFIAMADFQGRVTYLNRAGQQMAGLETQEEVANARLNDYLFPEDLEFHTETILPAVMRDGQWQGEFRFRHFQTGAPIWIDYSVFVLKDSETGEPMALGTVTRDISAAKATAEHEQRLIAVIENSPDYIGIGGPNGEVFYLNEAGRKMVGLDSEEAAANSNVMDYFAPEDAQFVKDVILPEVMANGRWTGEFRFYNAKANKITPVSYNLFAVRDKQTQEILALATVSRDITEQLQAEEERARLQEQVIEAQRMAIRELSTPLIPLADQIVAMPLVGTIDTSRAQQIMETLLEGCSTYQAEVVILDITGVKVVDSQVADGLVRTARAASLLGSEVVLTGISPEVAQTLVQIGIDLGTIVTRSTLQSGIMYALETRNLSFGAAPKA
jgi:rsbT co-antagonist protein RsbR